MADITGITEAELLAIAADLGSALRDSHHQLALAESCTGGMAAQYMTAIPGSSAWFDCGFVSYSNASKHALLGVSPATLTHHGAVSEETAQEMALGALKHSHANIAAAITGIAGPDGATPGKPVGTVCLAWADTAGNVTSETRYFTGTRQSIRQQSVHYCLKKIIALC